MSRTPSGLFLVGALNRPRKRKRTNRENPRRVPGQIGKIPGKVPKGQKGQKRKDKSRSGNPPFETPLLAALDNHFLSHDDGNRRLSGRLIAELSLLEGHFRGKDDCAIKPAAPAIAIAFSDRAIKRTKLHNMHSDGGGGYKHLA